MLKEKFVFLILHYLTIDETVNCVNSIKEKCKNNDYEIVIVENGSPNDSGEKLKEKYSQNEKIHLLFSKENLGFARGNNLGFKYAKENLNPDFIVMINNDIIMLQDDFCNRIIDEYNKSKFALLGPKIYFPNNIVFKYQDDLFTLKEYKRLYRNDFIFYYMNKAHLRYIYGVFDRIGKFFRKKKNINPEVRKEDVLLNGCCLIFSKEYINMFDGIDDRTFLYYEEHLLLMRLRKNNLKSVYNPDISILHNESVSTRTANKNKRKKFNFVLTYNLRSLKIVINELENK